MMGGIRNEYGREIKPLDAVYMLIIHRRPLIQGG